jgi:hypothetical protein
MLRFDEISGCVGEQVAIDKAIAEREASGGATP